MKNMKMKHMVIPLSFILLIILVLPSMIQVGIVDPLGVETKLTSKTGFDFKEISETKSEEIVKVVGVYDTDYRSGIDYLPALVQGVRVLDIFDTIGGVVLEVPLNRISELITLPFILRIDDGSQRVYACSGNPREATHVNWLATNYPGLDGDLDGDPDQYTPDDIVIAIVDTGISTIHQDMPDAKVIGWIDCVGTGGGGGGEDDDVITSIKPAICTSDNFDIGTYHGSKAAGIAAGTGSVDPTKSGVAPGAALVGVRVLDSVGSGTLEDVMEGFNWIADNKDIYGIEIVSCSFGFSPYTANYAPAFGAYDTLAMLADTLVSEHRLVVVCAAGNNGGEGAGTVTTPGTGKYVITVGGAYDPTVYEDGWAIWMHQPNQLLGSGRGPCLDGRIKPDILAPAWDLPTPDPVSTTQYSAFSATSAATAFVAGFCALWLDYDITLKQLDSDGQPLIKKLLMGAATDMPDDSNPGVRDNTYGCGRIDAQDVMTFYHRDMADSLSAAPLVYSIGGAEYWRYDEPIGFRDTEDWYKTYLKWGDILKVQYIQDDHEMSVWVSIFISSGSVMSFHSYFGNDVYLNYEIMRDGYYYVRIKFYSSQFDLDYNLRIWGYDGEPNPLPPEIPRPPPGPYD
ncbi:MAG: S8 family serine peptidase [Candidatus Thorarchaeota archaeon]